MNPRHHLSHNRPSRDAAEPRGGYTAQIIAISKKLLFSCEAHRLLNAAIPSKAIANAGLSRHRLSPAGALLKCLVLPAGFSAKRILYYVQERKIMNLSRDDNNSSGGRIDPNINETDTIVLINITAMPMII